MSNKEALIGLLVGIGGVAFLIWIISSWVLVLR